MSARRLQSFFRMPLRFLRGGYGLSMLAVVALACGVALVCALDLANRSVLDAFNHVVDTLAGKASLQVVAGESGMFPEELADEARAIRGVERVVPVVSGTVFTADGQPLIVHGMDLTNPEDIDVYERRDPGDELPDRGALVTRRDSILITRAFADRNRLGIEDGMVLETPRTKSRFVVRGILAGDNLARAFGGNVIVMDLYAAQLALTRLHFVNRLDLVVADGREDAVREAVAAKWPNLQVLDPIRRKVDIGRQVRSVQFVLYAVGLLGLVAAFLVAFNRLATVFDLRTWQLGILRAVGVRRRTVWLELTKEGALLGTAGVMLGLPLGIVLGRLAVHAISRTTSILLNVVNPEPQLKVRGISLLLAASLGFGAAILAAALPAWRTASMAVVTIIGGRGLETERPGFRAVNAVRAAVLGLIGVSVFLQWLTRSPAWGLLATGLIAVATAMLTRPLVTALIPILEPLARRLTGPDARFATATLRSHPRRSGLIVATLGVGLGSLVWLSTLIDSFETHLGEVIAGVVRADLVVTSARFAPNALEAPLDGSILDKLRDLPGIEAVAGCLGVDWHYGEGEPIALLTLDPDYFTDARFGRWPLIGAHAPDVWPALAEGRAILISSDFSLTFGTSTGDTIELDTPTGPLSVAVAGITSGMYSPRGTIYMSRQLYRERWGDESLTRVLIRTAPGAVLDDVQARIYDSFRQTKSIRVLRAREWVGWVLDLAHQAVAPIQVLRIVILVVVLFGMADTLIASVAERMREFGAVRALGVRRVHLRHIVLLEGLLLALCGLLSALATGLLLGVLWIYQTYPRLLGRVLVFHIPYGSIAILVGLTLLIALLAGLLPARRAMRLEPASALRYE